MSNDEAHRELNEILFAILRQEKSNKNDKRISALKIACKVLREKDQTSLFD